MATQPILGPYTTGQRVLWFPAEDSNHHEPVTIAEEATATDDYDATVRVRRAGDKATTSVRISHLITPAAWAELIKEERAAR